MKSEVHYAWKEYAIAKGESEPRFLTPWSDPHVHEFPFAYISDTIEEAIALKRELGAENEDWVLCVEYLSPVKLPQNKT